MTSKELLARAQWALSNLGAKVTMVDFDGKGSDRGKKPLLVIAVVSEQFKNLPVFSRTIMVDDILMKRDAKLFAHVEWAYECYTNDEFALGMKRVCELH